MGQVALSLIEYENLRQRDVRNYFSLEEDYNGEVKLTIKTEKAAEIFNKLFKGSVFDNGAYEIDTDKEGYKRGRTADVCGYYVKAVKKLKEQAEAQEQEEVEKDE